MKLIIAIIQDCDNDNLLNRLAEKGFQATKLASTGGFLREGNSTLMMGVDKEKVDDVLSIIEEVCKKREKYLPYSAHSDAGDGFAIAYSKPIMVGGAAVFVLDIDQYIKL